MFFYFYDGSSSVIALVTSPIKVHAKRKKTCDFPEGK